MKQIIFFRVDSSFNLGSGHIYRCLNIAEKLKSNRKIIFITNNFNRNYNFLLKGYNIEFLENSEHNFNLSKDLDQTINIINKFKSNKILIIDNYLLNFYWQKKIRKHVDKSVLIQDVIKKNYCDIYLNENLFNKKILFKCKKRNCIKLIGPKYCLIKKTFIYKKKKKNIPKKNTLFVFFGGSDKLNLTIKILNLLKNLSYIQVIVVVGKSNKKIKNIKKYASKNTKVFVQYSKIHNLIKKCDFAIVAGGCILWDLLYCRIPTLAICTASDQSTNLNNLYKKRFILYYDIKKKLNNNFLIYFLEKNNFNQFFLNKKKIVDGFGVIRLIKYLKR